MIILAHVIKVKWCMLHDINDFHVHFLKYILHAIANLRGNGLNIHIVKVNDV